ncbi:MAG: helix-turn-helix transcriptional regulator [Flavobacteriaceae bacterium]|nr:helix-turn-helix transcriptional regulator [Flavobacteriaceae bacterium]
MVFKNVTPKPPLDKFVLSIVYYNGFEVPHSKDKFLPDGTTNLVVNLLEPPRYIYDNDTLNELQECKDAWFSGMHTNYLTISSDNESEMLVITFKAGSCYPFIKQSVDSFNNKVVHAQKVFGDEIMQLRLKLIEASEPEDKIALAEQWLNVQLDEVSFQGEIIQQLVAEIGENADQLNLKELAERSGYSQKQFIHLFKKYVGLTPKQFHRIVRFNEILALMHEQKKVDWAKVATGCGYYDQAHFIKDFQAFSGINPKKYIEDQGEWPHYVPLR